MKDKSLSSLSPVLFNNLIIFNIFNSTGYLIMLGFNPFDLSQLLFGTCPGASCALDKSVEMLGDIFGLPVVQAIPLYGEAANAPTFVSLFSMMVTYFDWAAVGLISMIFAYIVIMATINTAHEGVAFGRQHNTTYTLIRAILGPVLMFPVPTTLTAATGTASLVTSVSTLQAIILHLVLVGVNMANIVWSHTVAAALYMPPSQLPGPIQNLISQQAAKLYLYQAAFDVMGLPDLSASPVLSVTGVQEPALADAPLYGYTMNAFYNPSTKTGYCNNASNYDSVNGPATPQSQCIQAVTSWRSSLVQGGSTGIIYPLSVGSDLSNGNVNSSSLTNNDNAQSAGSGDFRVMIYPQFRFSFGTNSPFFDNGNFSISNLEYSLAPLSSISSATGQLISDPFSSDPNPETPAAVLSDVTDIIKQDTSIVSAGSVTPPPPNGLFATVSSIAVTGGANPPAATAVQCGVGDPNGFNTASYSICNMGPAVDDMTQRLIAKEAAVSQALAASGVSQTTVPGTGTSCIEDDSIGAAIKSGVSVLVAPSGVSPDNTVFGVQLGNGSTDPSQNAQCLRESTSYGNGGNSVNTYYFIPSQDYSYSWWYGSEVYLSITQRLSDNIKRIAEDINQFSISDASLTGTGVSGSKTTTVNAHELDRNNFGHNIRGILDLTNSSPVSQNMYDFYSALVGSGYTPPTSNTLTVNIGTGTGELAGTAFVTPTWANTICIFNPNATSFLSAGGASSGVLSAAQALVTNALGTPDSCFSQAFANGIIQPPSGGVGNNPAAGSGNDYGALFTELQNVPADYQAPIQLMIMWEIQVNLPLLTTYPEQLANAQSLAINIENMITILKLNHVYPGSATSGDGGIGVTTEVQPATDVLTDMFSRVLGNNSSGSMIMGQALGGVMNDIYSIGNQEIGSGPNSVMESSYNNIAQVQQVGLEMIDVVVSSIQMVYQSIEDTANNYISDDHDIYEKMKDWAYGGAAASTVSSLIDPSLGAATAAAVQVRELAYSVVLQFKIVQQSYSMGSMIMWLPLIITVSTALFVAGVSFAILVPIMPFILYWSGQISWLLSVMEAVIAAPLLCLAWAVPGGHQHMGHTLAGLKVLIGIVFRPVLMVLGLFSALILTFILIKFSSQAFQIVSSQILSFASSMGAQAPSFWEGSNVVYRNNASMTEGVLAVLMLLLFCSLMVMAFNKCFSMIYMIPEKVLGWIGIQVQSTGAQDAEKLSGGVTQSAQQGAQSAGSTAQAGAQTQSTHASQSGGADSSAAQSQMQIGSAMSGMAQQKSPSGGGTSDAGGGASGGTPPVAP